MFDFIMPAKNVFTQMHINIIITDGSEEQQSIRSKRAKKPRTPGAPAVVPEPDQRLDNDQSEISSPVIPTGFLSPSVKEYLELGKSIPGKIIAFNNIFQFNGEVVGGPKRGRWYFRANKL